MAQKLSITVDDLDDGQCKTAKTADGLTVAVYNVGGDYYATDCDCPHQGASLGDGALEGDVVTCGWHGWEFNVKTGECLNVPDQEVKTRTIIKKGKELYLEE